MIACPRGADFIPKLITVKGTHFISALVDEGQPFTERRVWIIQENQDAQALKNFNLTFLDTLITETRLGTPLLFYIFIEDEQALIKTN